jgi:hypothetical protein
MINSLSLFSTWSVGVLNGCKPESIKEDFPRSIAYSSIAVTSLLHMTTAIGKLERPHLSGRFAGLFVVIPAMVGSIFCVGHQTGKAIRFLTKES